MSFNEVYNTLIEIFPEVDPRALRAVAIEHNKDCDAAVEIVLNEIVPFFVKISRPPSSSTGNNSSGFILNNDGILVETSDSEDEEQNTLSFYDAKAGDCTDDHVEEHGVFSCKVEVESEESEEENHTNASIQLADLAEGSVHAHISSDTGGGRLDESLDYEMDMAGEKVGSQENNLGAEDKLVSPERNGELVEADMIATESKYLEPNGSLITESNKESVSDIDINNDASLNTLVSQSNEIGRVEFLEGLVSDARNNKKTLLSAMESVISLIGKVELQEDATEQAEEEAAKGGSAILNTVEELINMLQHAKEANNMHAGEVYGERAVLATEVREFQSRLFSLSEERDKSLAILDEMHEALLSRLGAAEEKEIMANKEKLEKEQIARKSLGEQELIMEKVVQESNMLKQMAEKNAKLQEFLEDRGRVVDSLQGEICVICQDVKILREKFDEHVPLSKSFSSLQTSCRLASSLSSSKSSASADQVDEVSDRVVSTNYLQKSDLLVTICDHLLSAEQPEGDKKKALVEEGWEIFEDSDYAVKD